MYECRCDERLKTKVGKSTHITYTGLLGDLEHLKTFDEDGVRTHVSEESTPKTAALDHSDTSHKIYLSRIKRTSCFFFSDIFFDL